MTRSFSSALVSVKRQEVELLGFITTATGNHGFYTVTSTGNRTVADCRWNDEPSPADQEQFDAEIKELLASFHLTVQTWSAEVFHGEEGQVQATLAAENFLSSGNNKGFTPN